MSVNKTIFQRDREFNYDFQSVGSPSVGWDDANIAAEDLVPTHCCFCGVQCGMNLRVADGKVIGVEPRDYPHNQGSLCPKGVVAYQQTVTSAAHPLPNDPARRQRRKPGARQLGRSARVHRGALD